MKCAYTPKRIAQAMNALLESVGYVCTRPTHGSSPLRMGNWWFWVERPDGERVMVVFDSKDCRAFVPRGPLSQLAIADDESPGHRQMRRDVERIIANARP